MQKSYLGRSTVNSLKKVIKPALFAAVIAAASGTSYADKPEISLDFNGYVAAQAGEIVKGEYGGGFDTLDHQWQQRMLGGFNISATVNKRLKVVFGPECELTQSVYDLSSNTAYSADLESMHAFFVFYLNQMQGIYSIGDVEDPFLQISIGYFPFSYNNNIKSLGEYLFRATAYPGYIINDFDAVYKRLAGLHVTYKPIENLKLDFLLTTELQAPVGDYTPSLLASYAIGGEKSRPVVEVGAGVSFTRLISVNPALTTPHYAENMRLINVDTIQTANGDSIVGDSIFYSFAATKVMARFSLDPKPLFGNPGFFGDEDLKLYGEGCILGVKDYPIYYEDIGRRIPIMLGFNVPTFKILDVLSIEVEWYNDKYSNNYQLTYFPRDKTPLPVVGQSEPKPYPWYWDIYAARTITRGIQVLFDFGRTHYFTQAKLPNYQDRREELPNFGDWQFTGRIQYSF
jgi:hypothetical protein